MIFNYLFQCPCAENKKIEAARLEKAYNDEKLRKKLEKRAQIEKEVARREDILEKRKQKYYESLKKAEMVKDQPQVMRSKPHSAINNSVGFTNGCCGKCGLALAYHELIQLFLTERVIKSINEMSDIFPA